MTGPKRIQLRRTKGWRMPEGAVKVDRSTDHGNPYVIEKHRAQAVDGWVWTVRAPSGREIGRDDTPDAAAQRAVDAFRAWLADGSLPAQRRLIKIREELRGRDLACWCKPESPCHADVLLELANQGDPA